MTIAIAAMTADDYDDVLELWRSTEGVGLNEGDTRQGVAAYLIRNPGLSLVARSESRFIAAVLCGHDGRRGYLHHLAVARSHRGRGLGSQLVEACLARLAARGIQKCNLFVYAHNDPGTRFWKKNGWSERTELRVLSKLTRTDDALA